MKKIYLVQFEEYSDAFTAFEDYGNAYDFASVYIESMPNPGAKTASAMIRDAFLMDNEPGIRDVICAMLDEELGARDGDE